MSFWEELIAYVPIIQHKTAYEITNKKGSPEICLFYCDQTIGTGQKAICYAIEYLEISK
jgi:hypothetical protein